MKYLILIGRLLPLIVVLAQTLYVVFYGPSDPHDRWNESSFQVNKQFVQLTNSKLANPSRTVTHGN